MQGLILITAMTATGGLFGGKPACQQGGQHRVVRSTGYAMAPATYAPAQYAPAAAAAAPQAYAVPPVVSYNSFYSSGGCATGNCPRR